MKEFEGVGKVDYFNKKGELRRADRMQRIVLLSCFVRGKAGEK